MAAGSSAMLAEAVASIAAAGGCPGWSSESLHRSVYAMAGAVAVVAAVSMRGGCGMVIRVRRRTMVS